MLQAAAEHPSLGDPTSAKVELGSESIGLQRRQLVRQRQPPARSMRADCEPGSQRAQLAYSSRSDVRGSDGGSGGAVVAGAPAGSQRAGPACSSHTLPAYRFSCQVWMCANSLVTGDNPAVMGSRCRDLQLYLVEMRASGSACGFGCATAPANSGGSYCHVHASEHHRADRPLLHAASQGLIDPAAPEGTAASVFAVFDEGKKLQYVGFSKDIRNSLRTVFSRRPDKVFFYKCACCELMPRQA